MAIVVAMVMLLYMGGEPIEYTYHEGISSCLKQKREIERYGWKDRELTRYSCERRKVEIIESKKEVVRIVE